VQIIIPMSGFGERFRRAGYDVPKPLIPVEGKPIIAHVVDLFPRETNILFICNQDHLDEPGYVMAKQLRAIAPRCRIIGIPAHRKGPVWAVLQARALIDRNQPTFVNYSDFSCYWDWFDFKRFVQDTACAGAIPAYRGFHPHSLGSTYYAYLRARAGWLEDIQEKQPFTEDPTDEYASSGGYYFKDGAVCLDAFQAVVDQDLHVGGEYYASLSYKILVQRSAPVAIYELQHFMQWGTPEDLHDYMGWSAAFRRLAVDDARRSRHSGSVLVPMAGEGKRFAHAGYKQPKPLIPVSGRPMVIQATRDLPDAPVTRFVLRRDIPQFDEILRKLRTSFVGVSEFVLDRATAGQAITCQHGLAGLDLEAPLTIGACDNGMLYDVHRLEELLQPGGPDVLVWVVRGHPGARLRPEMFGWVETDGLGRVTKVRVKHRPNDPASDAMLVGAFTFRRAADFNRTCERLCARDGRVNGEFYVDSLIEDAVALGLDCGLFEIDHYLGWGTPNDLRTFEYWQSCFHKWPSHPYRLEKDKRVPSSRVHELANRFCAVRPERPRTARLSEHAPDTLAMQGVRFVPVGVLAVVIDFVLYVGLTSSGVPISISKAVSFIAGAVAAFVGNRYFTFRRRSGGSGFAVFVVAYLVSLWLNVAVNASAITLLNLLGIPSGIGILAAFIAATGVSATVNFFAMKLFVFRGARTS
jgi:putative flippase GtrA/NDP-sugar pyrophosphorylase family protein